MRVSGSVCDLTIVAVGGEFFRVALFGEGTSGRPF